MKSKTRHQHLAIATAYCGHRAARASVLLTGLVMVVGMSLLSAPAWAEEKVTISAAFSPDKLGAPALVKGGAEFSSTTSRVPSPISKITIIGPAGLSLDLKGSATCSQAILEEKGPEGCPARSVAGSGGGMGIFELAGQIIEEAFTVEVFVGNNKPGHYEVLLYVNAVSPVSVQLVFHAVIVQFPKPYGLGFSFDVPEVKTLPEASNASVKNAHLTLGATPAEQKHFHVKGIIVPKKCPKGGFPDEAIFGFEDGSTVAAKSTIPCPKSSKKH